MEFELYSQLRSCAGQAQGAAYEGRTMRLTAAKWFATAVLSLSAFGVASTSTEAEACGFFRSLFGCCGGGCGGGYGAYYGPRMGWGYGSTCCGPSYGGCAPCGSACSPCGPSGCVTCDSGNCSVAAPSSLTPVPNEDWKAKEKNRTYAEPAPADATGTGAGESGNSRTNSESGLNKDDDGLQPAAGSNATGTGSLSGDSGSKIKTPILPKGSKKGPPATKADDAGGKNSGKAPTISIDEKVAWRNAPARQRIEVRSHAANARLVRLSAYPKSEWLPVETESKVAARK